MVVEGKKEFRGKRLPPVPVEDDLYWGVMKYWYPELQLTSVETGAPPKVLELNGSVTEGNLEEYRFDLLHLRQREDVGELVAHVDPGDGLAVQREPLRGGHRRRVPSPGFLRT